MKLWITGARGLVGSTLLAEAASYAFGTGSEVDIAESEVVEALFERERPTHIVNAAAYTAVDKAEGERERAFRTNCTGPRVLAELAKRRGVPMVHLSTDYVFDGLKGGAYAEDDLCAPLSHYGLTKWEGEKEALRVNPDVCVVRTSWVFGRGGKTLISLLPGLIMSEKEVAIVSDQASRLTYAPDLASAVLALLGSSGIYHFANSGKATRYEVALFMRELLGGGVVLTERSLAEFKLPAARPLVSELSTTKVEARLGKRPRSWRAAVTEFVACGK